MDKERVIVYIDENTDEGMMYEEFNQNGQMQVSVYDEEYEYDVEYCHRIVVKSLQEHLADYTKQVRKEFCEKIRENAISHNNLEVDMYYITPQQLYEIEQGEPK